MCAIEIFYQDIDLISDFTNTYLIQYLKICQVHKQFIFINLNKYQTI